MPSIAATLRELMSHADRLGGQSQHGPIDGARVHALCDGMAHSGSEQYVCACYM